MTAPPLAKPTPYGRFYVHPRSRAEVPSITNIIGMKYKPLFKAGLRKAADYAADNREVLATLDRDSAYKLVSDPPEKDASPSAIGDLVHGWAEEFIRSAGAGPPEADVAMAPQTAKWMWERFLTFNRVYEPEYTATEFTVWSNAHAYAGTADFSAKIRGSHVLVDIKTGKYPYSEVAMQLAAIQKADFVLTEDGTESGLPVYDRYAVLHLRPRGGRLHPVENIGPAFEAFKALKVVFDWNKDYAERSIVQAPKFN